MQKQWKIDQNWIFVVIVVYGVGHSSIKTLQGTQHFTSIVRFVMMKFSLIVIDMHADVFHTASAFKSSFPEKYFE